MEEFKRPTFPPGTVFGPQPTPPVDLDIFLAVARKVNGLDKTLAWPIPKEAQHGSGDLSLLPEDKEIRPWQIGWHTAEFLRMLVVLTGARTILELGTSLGFSGMWLALGAYQTRGHVWGTEIFSPKAELAKQHLQEAGVDALFTLLERDILEVLNNWNPNQKIDFVFLDADKQRYRLYWLLLQPLLSDNALIVMDNANSHGELIADFLREVEEAPGFILSYLDVDHGLLLIRKGGGLNAFPATSLSDTAWR